MAAEVAHQHVGDVEQQQEQERCKQVARQCQRAGNAAGQRTQGAPEHRVADAGQRAHQTGLDRVDGVGVKVLLRGVLLLHGRCDAEDEGAEHGRGVEELSVTLQCLAQLLLVRIQLPQDRGQRILRTLVHLTLVIKGCIDRKGSPENLVDIALGEQFFLVIRSHRQHLRQPQQYCSACSGR